MHESSPKLFGLCEIQGSGFQLVVLCHCCRKISTALGDKQRQTHSGTFIDNIKCFLSFDIWIFLKCKMIGVQSCCDFGRLNTGNFNWLSSGIIEIGYGWPQSLCTATIFFGSKYAHPL